MRFVLKHRAFGVQEFMNERDNLLDKCLPFRNQFLHSAHKNSSPFGNFATVLHLSMDAGIDPITSFSFASAADLSTASMNTTSPSASHLKIVPLAFFMPFSFLHCSQLGSIILCCVHTNRSGVGLNGGF